MSDRVLKMALPVPPTLSDLPETPEAMEVAGRLMQIAARMVHEQGISPKDRMSAFAFALGWIAQADDRACDACEAMTSFLGRLGDTA